MPSPRRTSRCSAWPSRRRSRAARRRARWPCPRRHRTNARHCATAIAETRDSNRRGTVLRRRLRPVFFVHRVWPDRIALLPPGRRVIGTWSIPAARSGSSGGLDPQLGGAANPGFALGFARDEAFATHIGRKSGKAATGPQRPTGRAHAGISAQDTRVHPFMAPCAGEERGPGVRCGRGGRAARERDGRRRAGAPAGAGARLAARGRGTRGSNSGSRARATIR